MTNSDDQTLSDLTRALERAAGKAAAALSMLVKQGLVTTPSAVNRAQECDAAVEALRTELARQDAMHAIEKARESSLRAIKGGAD